MKKISVKVVMGIFLLLASFSTKAQTGVGVPVTIEPYRLEISNAKTTNIIFPQGIISVDRGSRDVLAQKAKGVENILQVKAARDSITETNLTVVTADGRLNSFVVYYAAQPSVLNISVASNVQSPTIFLSPENVNQAEVQSLAGSVAGSKKKVRGIRDSGFGICFKMDGLFIHEEILYWRIKISNQSNISYTIGQLRFFIRDQKKSKRTATQEIEVTPVYVQNNTDKVAGQTEKTLVFALPKFTMPDDKFLTVQLMENNGGRHLELKIKNRHLFRALPIQ